MKKITGKEEEIMNLFWKHGPMFVRELLDYYDEPKPHFNTVSTFVRGLEEKGFLSHKAYGKSHQYYATIDQNQYNKGTLKYVVENYFNHSYLNVVSSLVKEEEISIEDLKHLIQEVEQAHNKNK